MSFNFKYPTLSRIITLAFIGILILILANLAMPEIKPIPFLGYVIAATSYILVGEGLLFFNKQLTKYTNWSFDRKRRFILLSFISSIWIVIVVIFAISIGDKFIADNKSLPNAKIFYYLAVTFGLLTVVIYVTALIAHDFRKNLESTLLENERLKQEKLKLDYKILQEQLNPHFLFNNLSVLKSLIIYDKETALTFTQNFTDVYRYVLQSKDKKTISLKHELDFIKAYIGLHKERLGEGLKISFSIKEESLNKNIPPLTLQLLIENAIKHNIASKKKPLEIEIKTQTNFIYINNNVHLKEASYSTHSGLKNLKERFDLLSNEKIIIENDSHFFKVKIPLL